MCDVCAEAACNGIGARKPRSKSGLQQGGGAAEGTMQTHDDRWNAGQCAQVAREDAGEYRNRHGSDWTGRT